MKRLILATFFAAACAGAAAAAAIAGPAQDLAGRYASDHVVGMVHEPAMKVEDVVEIVPVAADAAFLHLRLTFFNGHICELSGVARADGNALVYREPEEPDQPRRCTLRVERAGASLRLSDGGGSCFSYCGARGSLDGATLPFRSRRAITYMEELRASDSYRWAIEEWRTGRRVLP